MSAADTVRHVALVARDGPQRIAEPPQVARQLLLIRVVQVAYFRGVAAVEQQHDILAEAVARTRWWG